VVLLILLDLTPANYQISIHQYWSPAERRPAAVSTLFTDGGNFENVPLINFLQRRVEKIVVCYASSVPLQPKSVWNVTEDPDNLSYITNDFSSFFGVLPKNYDQTVTSIKFFYQKNQVSSSTAERLTYFSTAVITQL
jgi:hypothetical protein